jgi:L-malate glycosyltransferase
VILSFLAPSARRPVGGVTAIYEIANAMSRQGNEVHLVHLPWRGDHARGLDDLRWCELDGALQHHFQDELDERTLPRGDFVLGCDARLPERLGLPVVFVLGYKAFGPAFEEGIYRLACPKICISQWLVDVGIRMGIPRQQLVHVPLGVRHDKYRLLTPIENRPARIAMVYARFPTKGTGIAMKAIEGVKGRVSSLAAVTFGTLPPAFLMPIPPWFTHLHSPETEVVVREIYNSSSIFICASKFEGFGLPSLEAMACGCALVTTSNGGSDEFAVDGETALICEPRDAVVMADQIERLLSDDELRLQLARGGYERAKEFDWDVTARKLESFLGNYAMDPPYYRGISGIEAVES